MERTIRVTGKGKISVKPDTIRLLITQSSTEPAYDRAIRESADKKNVLSEALSKLGFEKNVLKTMYFNVDTERQSYQAKDKSWKSRLIGYRYTHRMKLEFPADNKMLGKVLLAVSKCPGEPEFTIQYTVADPEAAKNELLAKAVEDSRVKATVLTGAAGVRLADICTIDYSWGEIDIISRPVDAMMVRDCCSMTEAECGIDLDIDADDIDVTDTVTIVWRIE